VTLPSDIIEKLENLGPGQMIEIPVHDFRTITKDIVAWMQEHKFRCEVKHYRSKGDDFITVHVARLDEFPAGDEHKKK
jgi:TusA-related sulfurtransferase